MRTEVTEHRAQFPGCPNCPKPFRAHSFARFARSLRSGELNRAWLRGKAPPPRAENLLSPASREGACGAGRGRRTCAAAGRSQRRRRSLPDGGIGKGFSAEGRQLLLACPERLLARPHGVSEANE